MGGGGGNAAKLGLGALKVVLSDVRGCAPAFSIFRNCLFLLFMFILIYSVVALCIHIR